MTDKTVAAGWRDFWQASMDDFDGYEEEHMRVAFYCGAFFMLKTMGSLTTLVVGDHGKIDEIKKELTEFHDEELRK